MKKAVNLSLALIMTVMGILILANCAPEAVTSSTTTTTLIPHDVLLQGTYTTNVTVDSNSTVLLRNQVKFEGSAVLTLGEGVTVLGDPYVADTSYLIIDIGAQLVVSGTASNPVTFTSGRPAGQRGPEDWGGVIINGDATINGGSGTPLQAEGEGNSGLYGGTNDAHNGGSIQYMRIFFAGKQYGTENELNGLCLQGVGSNTVVDYYQAHNCKDDGIEMFGGTVNIKHVVASANGDDQIDGTYGWRGFGQYLIADGTFGDEGFEHDNNGSDNYATPQGMVYYANITTVDQFDTNTFDAPGGGLYIREGMWVDIYNAYLVGGEYGLRVNNSNTTAMLTNSLIEGSIGDTFVKKSGDAATVLTVGSTNVSSTVTYLTTADFDSLSSLETAGAAAYSPGVSAIAEIVDISAGTDIAAWFDDTDFLGAVENDANNWLTGWTEFPAN